MKTKIILLCLFIGVIFSVAHADSETNIISKTDTENKKEAKIDINKIYTENEKRKSGFMADGKTLFQEITGIEKKQNRFNLYLNMQGSFDLKFNDGFDEGNFYMRQFRIEAKGEINDWLYYRYRQRLNRGNNGSGNIDNMPTSIDYAAIGVKLGSGFSLFAGKQCAAYGGFEFDLNPIDVYEYCDMIEYMSNFMTGLNVIYDVTPMQQFQLQILDSRNSSLNDTYGTGFQKNKLPLVYTLNWNGNFNNVFKTRWSASLLSETKHNNMYYFALGNEVTAGRFNGFLDFMYSIEDIDRKGIITSMVGQTVGVEEGSEVFRHNAMDARYMSWVLKLNYRVAPKWNIFAKGMYETASTFKKVGKVEKGKYRTAWGYLAGLEYYPMETNLHFFLTYVGRSYNFTDRAEHLGFDNYSTNRVSIGFIYQLPVF